MTGRSIDHVVHAVKDLDQAAQSYEELGFTLTPRAQHEDRMGTSNRLAQFKEKNFIELLEVDRPGKLAPHDFDLDPPFFGFGAFNKQYLSGTEGMSMVVFASDDAHADCARFAANGVSNYAPFDFERQATLPDGQTVTVSFSLAFATSPDMPGIAFFVCQNRAQEHFWKPEFQKHTNGVTGINSVVIVTSNPLRDAEFVSRMFDGAIEAVDGGQLVACGPNQSIALVDPGVIQANNGPDSFDPERGPSIAGIVVNAESGGELPSDLAVNGAFIRPASTKIDRRFSR